MQAIKKLLGMGAQAPKPTEELPLLTQWKSKWLTPYPHTPDIAILQQYELQLLFCPDDLKAGHRNEKLLGDEKMLMSKAFTEERYTFWRKNLALESYPIPLDRDTSDELAPSWADQKGAPRARIGGELYALRPNLFIDLDKFKENGVQFTRQRVKLIVPYKNVMVHDWREDVKDKNRISLSSTEKKMYSDMRFFTSQWKFKTVRAWMYMGSNTYWEDQLETFSGRFSPVKIFRPNSPEIEPYYSFTKYELPRLAL
jgi:hypothetical protein